MKKISAANRREAILSAAMPVFARLGPAGATTKEIAKAAGISEALIYKHFPGKESLYAQLEAHCVEANSVGARALEGAPASTATLVTGVAILVQAVFPGIGDKASHENTKRLVTISLLNDGHFARVFLERHVQPWVAVFQASLRMAIAEGDVQDGTDVGQSDIWFVHHLANTLHLISMPKARIVDYDVPHDALIEHAVRFLLRGLGLKNQAIDRYYDPAAIRLLLFPSIEA